MVRRCVAYKCDNNSKNRRGSSVSFHQFPTDPDQRKLWVTATKRSNFALKSAVLCSTHFEKSCFEFRTGSAQLKKDAVPTIFTFPPDCSPERNTKRKRALISESEMTNTGESENIAPQTDLKPSRTIVTAPKKNIQTITSSNAVLDLLKRMRPIRPYPEIRVIENLPISEPEILLESFSEIETPVDQDPLLTWDFEKPCFENRIGSVQLKKEADSTLFKIPPECKPERSPIRTRSATMTNPVSQADSKPSIFDETSQKQIIQAIKCSSSPDKRIIPNLSLLKSEPLINSSATNLNPLRISESTLQPSVTKLSSTKISCKRKKFTSQNPRCKQSDISSMSKVRRKWTVTTATNQISVQRRKIAQLKRANRRLRLRVKDLKSLVVTHLL